MTVMANNQVSATDQMILDSTDLTVLDVSVPVAPSSGSPWVGLSAITSRMGCRSSLGRMIQRNELQPGDPEYVHPGYPEQAPTYANETLADEWSWLLR